MTRVEVVEWAKAYAINDGETIAWDDLIKDAQEIYIQRTLNILGLDALPARKCECRGRSKGKGDNK